MTIEIKIIADNAGEARSMMQDLINNQSPVPQHKTVKEGIEAPIEDLPGVTEETLPHTAINPVPQHTPPPDESENPAPIVPPPPAAGVIPPPPAAGVMTPIANDEVERDILDSEFLPWDKRIHSTSKKKVADGSWRIIKKPKEFPNSDDWHDYIDKIKKEINAVRIQGLTDPTEPQNFEALTKFGLTVVNIAEFLEIIRKYGIKNMSKGNLPENRVLIPVIYGDLVKIQAHRNENN